MTELQIRSEAKMRLLHQARPIRAIGMGGVSALQQSMHRRSGICKGEESGLTASYSRMHAIAAPPH